MDSYTMYYLLGLILLPGIIFSAVVQTNINNAYTKYSKVNAKIGVSASLIAKALINKLDLGVNIKKIDGQLTDYYDSKQNIIAISKGNYDSTSIASLGIVAHEIGHASQHNDQYPPLIIRSFFVKICNFSSKILWPLVVIGIIFNCIYIEGIIGNIFMIAGMAFFWISFLLNIITLPVEYNASKRGLKMLTDNNIISNDETLGVKKVLNAAALTYVAAALVSLLQLLRFAVLIAGRRRD